MACPALPLCGLAIGEAERTLVSGADGGGGGGGVPAGQLPPSGRPACSSPPRSGAQATPGPPGPLASALPPSPSPLLVQPDINARIRKVMDSVGLPKDDKFVVRMTGEPEAHARMHASPPLPLD